MKILVIAEHDNRELKNSTLNTLTAAVSLSQNFSENSYSIDILVAGFQCESVAQKIATAADVSLILYADDKAYQHHTAENIADLVAAVATENQYDYILGAATTFGKNFLPRVAALLDVEQISDVCNIVYHSESTDNPIAFLRPIYAGNALQTVISLDPIKILSIRVSAYNAYNLNADINNTADKIKKINARPDLNLSQFLSLETVPTERPELNQAKTIVSGGRGFQSAEKFKLIESLADKLNAAIGASRAAVDAGFAPNDYQVGQTGKIVAPNLYIAIGISGAIQHLAGMKDSRVIVAINKDAEAPIFKIATYGLVGDLFEIIPDFIAELDK